MMFSEKPKIEVIMPFHRIDDYLVAAIESIKSSVNVEVRIIAINDTGEHVDFNQLSLNGSDILIDTAVRGYVNALRMGVEASSEKYVSFLDSDDLVHPEKLSRQVTFLNQCNLDFVSCRLQKINSRNRISKHASLLGEVPRTHNVRELWVIGSHGADSTLLCDGVSLREHWSNHQKFESHFADYGWALSLPTNLEFGQLEDKLYFYRSHSAQISKSPPLGDSWKLIYPLWRTNLMSVFPEFPKNLIPSEHEALAIAFPASMIKLSKGEFKNLVKFEKAMLDFLKDRNINELSEWKRTLARRLLLASRGTSVKHWHAAPRIAWTALCHRLFGFGFRKIN
jgi:glycosyltransferase involved in cell wall biosynthesis